MGANEIAKMVYNSYNGSNCPQGKDRTFFQRNVSDPEIEKILNTYEREAIVGSDNKKKSMQSA